MKSLNRLSKAFLLSNALIVFPWHSLLTKRGLAKYKKHIRCATQCGAGVKSPKQKRPEASVNRSLTLADEYESSTTISLALLGKSLTKKICINCGSEGFQRSTQFQGSTANM